MKILVLLKYSLDVAEIKVDPATRELRLAGVPEKVGNIEKNVVEAAVKLKESAGGTVQGLTFGPAVAKDGFKDVLAMGVDEVFLIEDPFKGKADPTAVVQVLDAAIRKLGPFDLVLCGFASDDGYTYQVGPRLAERLGLPLVSYARRLSVDGAALTADSDLGEWLETVQTPLPALVSVAEEAFPPRRTTLMDAIKAKKKPVNIWSVETDLGLTPSALNASGQVESTEEVGVVVQRKKQIWKSTNMPELADRLIDALVAENVLKGGA
ncbi:MAG TPA: electron transfer flavoprotein subunit beta/FixA family protein [Anaerolineales bacterium]